MVVAAGVIMAGASKRTALVTGGLGAIGGALVCDLADKKVDVCVVDRAPGEAKPGVDYEICDLGSLEAIDDLASRLAERGSQFDYVVHCAGVTQHQPLYETPRDEWLKVLSINLVGPMALTQVLIPQLREGGAMVFVSSGTIFKGTVGHSAYVAAKSGLVGFGRTMARELGAKNITVNCVAPGLTATQLVPDLDDREPDQIASRAIKRREVAEDVVGAISFLLSPEAHFITGQTLVVDGGSVMH